MKNKRLSYLSGKVVGNTIIHVAGWIVCTVSLVFVTFPPDVAAEVLSRIAAEQALRTELVVTALKHASLGLTVWLISYLLFVLGSHRLRENPVRRTQLSRGTVMVETLIIFPVFLLLLFGLLQLSINNIASILTSYAGFSGTRAVWVWDGEVASGRRGMDEQQMLERVRIQVAMAMAPIATGEFLNDEAALSTELQLARLAMHRRFNFLGSDATALLAATNFSANKQAYEGNKSIWRALDGESFANRAVRKLTRAYLATNVGTGEAGSADEPGIIVNGDEIGLRFTYQHHQTMPLVSPIFGDFGTSGGRGGYFNELSKQHTLPRQRHNPGSGWPSR